MYCNIRQLSNTDFLFFYLLYSNSTNSHIGRKLTFCLECSLVKLRCFIVVWISTPKEGGEGVYSLMENIVCWYQHFGSNRGFNIAGSSLCEALVIYKRHVSNSGDYHSLLIGNTTANLETTPHIKYVNYHTVLFFCQNNIF